MHLNELKSKDNDCDRWAGDDSSGAGGEYPTRLRFNTKDDALNFARQEAERGRRWARERGLSFSDD